LWPQYKCGSLCSSEARRRGNGFGDSIDEASQWLDEDSIEKFLVDVGLRGNIKTTLKLLVADSSVLPSEEVVQNCTAAITLRNAIMHKGRRGISHREVSDLMNSIESMIRFCEALINRG